MIKVSILIVKYIERMDRKFKNYKNSGVRFIYKLVAFLYMFPVIFEDSKIVFNLGIFFTMVLLMIITIIFRIIKIDLLINTVYFIDVFVKRLSGYISEYSLSRLLKW